VAGVPRDRGHAGHGRRRRWSNPEQALRVDHLQKGACRVGYAAGSGPMRPRSNNRTKH
jgi:hypothetical protein